MSFAHVVAYFSWPVIALGIAGILVLGRRKQRGDRPWPFVGLLALILVISSFVLLIAYGQATKANLLSERVIYTLLGLWFLRLAPRIWRGATKTPAKPNGAATNSSPARKRSSAVFTAILGISLFLFSAYDIIGDYFFKPMTANGFVTGKYITHSRYGLSHYHVRINGHSFPVTEDLYEKTATTSYAKITLGRASHTIFQLSTIPIVLKHAAISPNTIIPQDIWAFPSNPRQH